MGRRGRVRKFGTDNGFEEQGGYMAAKKAKLEEQFEKGILKTICENLPGLSHQLRAPGLQ